MTIVKMNGLLCKKYHDILAEYYYNNATACCFIGEFTKADASLKIDDMTKYVEEDKAVVFGCVEDEKLIGYVWAYENDFRAEHRMYISEIYVSEECRSRGIGKLLLENVESFALTRGIRAIYIHAEAVNAGAIRLYESEGFNKERIQLRKEL